MPGSLRDERKYAIIAEAREVSLGLRIFLNAT
jgi:hypothetical protein